jgi:hypothetical protein
MQLDELTLAAFTACNSMRILAYIPQIHKAATDNSGAVAISCTTWLLFLVAHLSTVAYAIVNQADWSMAACFAGNGLCCVAILVVAMLKRRAAARQSASC